MVSGLTSHLRDRRVVAVAAGGGHSVVVTSLDAPTQRVQHQQHRDHDPSHYLSVFTCGWGAHGQLGHGGTHSRDLPGPVMFAGVGGTGTEA
jgi:alpha-tubulin suppressor-like RCC1 family protein